MLYLDNIIIWLQTVEEHEQNVAKVLDALRAAKLFCNKKKSVLFATEVFFLGHIISDWALVPIRGRLIGLSPVLTASQLSIIMIPTNMSFSPWMPVTVALGQF